MNVEIKNFKNIKEFSHTFERGKVHLIYAGNGTGKTSIAQALTFNNNEKEKFKSHNDDWDELEVKKDKDFSIFLLDENFITLNILNDEIFNDSYEIIFNNDSTKKLEGKIEEQKVRIAEFLKRSECIDLKKQLAYIDKNLGIKGAKKDELKITNLTKAISNLPKTVPYIDEELKSIFNSQKLKSKWVAWIQEGEVYTHVHDSKICPYCAQNIDDKRLKSINLIKASYNKKDLEEGQKFLQTYGVLSDNIKVDTNRMDSIYRGNIKSKVSVDAVKIILNRSTRLQKLISDLERITAKRHNEAYIRIKFNSKDFINDTQFYSELISMSEEYNGNVNKLNKMREAISKQLIKSIESNNNLIRDYLYNAGIPYVLEFILDSEKNTKLLLKYKSKEINQSFKNVLSYGEKNLISALLFSLMKKGNKNLYIYDDPSMLLDDHKRYAFIDLIIQRKNLKLLNTNDSTLILTHSMSTLKEFLIMAKERSGQNIKVWILKNNDGTCKLDEIKYRDLVIYQQIVKNQITKTKFDTVKLILIRKLVELGIIEDKQGKKYNLISSIFKYKRAGVKDNNRTYSKEENISTYKDLQNDMRQIGSNLDSYEHLVDSLRIDKLIECYNNSTNYFEKLINFRVITNFIKENIDSNILDSVDKIFLRFVTNLYHIENDSLFLISEDKHIDIPDYILNTCDRIVNKLSEKIIIAQQSKQFEYINLDSNFI